MNQSAKKQNANSDIIEAYQNMIQTRIGSGQQPSRFQYGQQNNQIFNKSAYAFGGVSNVDSVQRGSNQKQPIIEGFSPLVKNGFNEFTRVMPASAYVNKRSQQKYMTRVKSANCNRMNPVFAQSNTKTFYPEGYFKRVGYKKDNGKVRKTDALG